jgi:hypothetical protein
MADEQKELASILSFQKSLLRLVTRGNQEADSAKSKGPAGEHTRQLDSWARKVRAKAG